jgi:hypothetical protein
VDFEYVYVTSGSMSGYLFTSTELEKN